jgi:hypothetical protein
MFRLDLGGGAVAFEIEGEADRVSGLDPNKLIERGWPQEVIENYRRYRNRSLHSDSEADHSAVARERYSLPDGR